MRLKALWDEWVLLGGRRTWNRLTSAIWNTYFDTWIATGDWHLAHDDSDSDDYNHIWCKHLRWAWERPSITSCDRYDPLAELYDHKDGTTPAKSPRLADQ